MLRTRLTLRPGSPGTKRLVTEYGSRLVCVRHRYDPDRGLRWKTVELIVEEKSWPPPPRKVAPEPLEYVHIRFPRTDHATRRNVKRLGGYWDDATESWRITYLATKLLHLTSLIITPAHISPSTGADSSLNSGEGAAVGGTGEEK